jgi:16S rRNA (uracil1498-N3)-methyltransferase
MTFKKRYYLSLDFPSEGDIFLEGSEHQHLKNVMRSRVNDEVELVNGCGGIAEATIIEIERHATRLRVTSSFCEEPLPTKLCLVQSLIKSSRLDIVLEKATELGVETIYLWPSVRSEQKLPSSKLMERMKGIIVSALKQSRRLFLPKLEILESLEVLPKQEAVFFGDLGNQALLLSEVFDKTSSSIAFVVGPEGGLTEEEDIQLNSIGAQGVKINDNILRSETASIAALSILYYLKM